MNDGLVEDYQIGIGLSDWHQIGTRLAPIGYGLALGWQSIDISSATD